MRILTLPRIVAISAIGVAYVHGKRGGTWTLDSNKDTLNHLWTSASERLGAAKREVRAAAERTERRIHQSSTSSGSGSTAGSTAGATAGTSTANGLAGDRMRRPPNG